MSEKLFNSLNQQVANFTVLYEKLHHYHWFVKGTSFFTLHEQFENDYTEITGHVDDLAERLIQIGGKPVSSLKQYLETTTLTENQSSAVSSTEMVNFLLNDYRKIVSELKEAIDLSGETGDDVTQDLLIGISASFQKKIWLYESFNA